MTNNTYAFLDFEYTYNPKKKAHDIIEIGYIVTDKHGTIQEETNIRVRTTMPIDQHVQQLTGITNHHEGVYGTTAIKTMHHALKDCTHIYVFGADDKRVYTHYCRMRHIEPVLTSRFCNIIPLLKNATRMNQIANLTQLTHHLDTKKGRAHNALYDAYLLYTYMKQATVQFHDMDLSDITEAEQKATYTVNVYDDHGIVHITHLSERFGHVGQRTLHVSYTTPTTIKKAIKQQRTYNTIMQHVLVPATANDVVKRDALCERLRVQLASFDLT